MRGHGDVREPADVARAMLLIADHIQNSGKLALDNRVAFILHGFQAVYLFPYPEAAVVLRGGDVV